MKVSVGAATDIGQVREGNEDSYLVLDPLFAVADGMGGHRGGEVASDLAIRTIRHLFERRQGSLIEQVERANRAVFERSRSDREVSGMGTTLTAVVVDDRQARLAHVGDSRAYLLRGGELTLLTEDHTLVQRMVHEGELTPEEAEGHPHRNILTRVLGVDGAVVVDEGVLDLREGDRLLLCTDGLTGMVPDEEIRAVLEESRDPQEAAERLVRAANGAGGVDNITAVVLDVTENGAPTPARAREATSVPTPVAPLRTSVAPPPSKAERPPRPGVRKAVVWSAVALAVAILGLVGLRLYLDSQWYVGVSEGRVAIFRGVPAEVAGLRLSSVVVETTIPAEEAEALEFYRDLSEGITADDRAGADQIVEQIRDDVARAGATGS
jgi:serine/threonine protein phosphatase PrpC